MIYKCYLKCQVEIILYLTIRLKSTIVFFVLIIDEVWMLDMFFSLKNASKVIGCSTRLYCSFVQMQNILYHNQSGSAAFTGELKQKEVHRAITMHPVKQPSHLYRLHSYIKVCTHTYTSTYTHTHTLPRNAPVACNSRCSWVVFHNMKIYIYFSKNLYSAVALSLICIND